MKIRKGKILAEVRQTKQRDALKALYAQTPVHPASRQVRRRETLLAVKKAAQTLKAASRRRGK